MKNQVSSLINNIGLCSLEQNWREAALYAQTLIEVLCGLKWRVSPKVINQLNTCALLSVGGNQPMDNGPDSVASSIQVVKNLNAILDCFYNLLKQYELWAANTEGADWNTFIESADIPPQLGKLSAWQVPEL